MALLSRSHLPDDASDRLRSSGVQDPAIGLRLAGITKSFGTRRVLDDLNLTIAPGTFVAVVGRSGCGKSTLLRVAAGLETVDTGRVEVIGPLADPQDNDRIRIMFQDARLLPWKSVVDNVRLGLRPARSPATEARALEVLSQVGLADRARDWPAVLSGGQRQRVALARALAHRPGLLLLDEPLGALDALTRIEMQDLIETIWRQRSFSALLVTHDVEEAVTLADRVILIEDGRIALDVPVDLPRPRRRGDPAVAAVEGRVLDRVLGPRIGAGRRTHTAASLLEVAGRQVGG